MRAHMHVVCVCVRTHRHVYACLEELRVYTYVEPRKVGYLARLLPTSIAETVLTESRDGGQRA